MSFGDEIRSSTAGYAHTCIQMLVQFLTSAIVKLGPNRMLKSEQEGITDGYLVVPLFTSNRFQSCNELKKLNLFIHDLNIT